MRVLLVTATSHRALGSSAGRASLGVSYLRGLLLLGHGAELLDLGDVVHKYRWLRGRPLRALKTLLIAAEVGPLVRRSAVERRPDLVLVMKGNYLRAEVLQRLKREVGALTFHVHPDDFFNPDNTSSLLRAAIPTYDFMLTPKRFNVSELKAAGAKRVAHIPHGYDHEIHRPVAMTDEERAHYSSDVVFVGDWRKAREQVLEELSGYNLKIWGDGWQRLRRRSQLSNHVTRRSAYCEELAKVLGASKIALGLLNVENRDLSTGRSYEIPACGGFLLAERTSEHLELYEEGEEIECFDSVDELRSKIDLYLKASRAREAIAAAGHKKVTRMPWSYLDRMRQVAQLYNEMR